MAVKGASRFAVLVKLYAPAASMSIEAARPDRNLQSTTGSGIMEEIVDQFCDLLRRVLMAVVANAL